MKVRLITSALGAALFLVLLFAPSIVFQVAAVLVAGIAMYEIYHVTGISKKPAVMASCVIGMGLCALFGGVHMGVISQDMCFFAMSLYICYIFAIMVFDHKRIKLFDASVMVFATMILAVTFSYIIPLRAHENGMYLIIALFAATWGGDGGAYFVGIRFGKHKLAPTLSPKKTVEGAVGGVLGSVITMGIFSAVLTFCFGVECNVPMLMVTGVGCAILGPVSDIATSAIKREFNVKDYGNVFPGHGGILDRFDSVLLTTPFVYFMSEAFELIKIMEVSGK